MLKIKSILPFLKPKFSMNFILLLVIFLIQIIPSLIVDYLGDDLQWEMWHVSMLSIVVIQAFYIYKGLPFKQVYTKAIAFVIMLLSMYFVYDYTKLTTVYRYIERHAFLHD